MLSTILGHSGELCVSFSCIGSLSFVQVSGRICHRSIHTSHSSDTLLGGGFLAFCSSHHVGRHSSLLSYCTKCCQGSFSGWGFGGSAIMAFNPGYLEMCGVQTGVLFLSLSGSGMGDLNIYDKGYQQS